MHTIGQWLAMRLGVSPWIVGFLILPSLLVLLIFSVREVTLRLTFRFGKITKTRGAWRRVSLYVAVLASLVATGHVWRSFSGEILAAFSQLGVQSVDTLQTIFALGLYAAMLGVVLYGVQHGFVALSAWVDRWSGDWSGLRIQQTVFVSAETTGRLVNLGLRILRVAIALFLLYLFVPLLLESIPATRDMAHQVMPLIFQPLVALGRSIVGYIPNLVILVLIFVIARWTIKGFSILMRAVGSGDITLGGFDATWANQTYGIARVLMILATILIMYPFLPGSSSTVFHAFSVFVGALVTFGATTTTNNIFTGLILTYTRAFQAGDRVKIGGHVGDVIELGMVATRLQTLDNEKVTIANTEVLNGDIVNYSKATALGGLKLRVTAGIGYDTDWRQVCQLLIDAAQATGNVVSDPAPIVNQASLDDYAVSYSLVVVLEDPTLSIATRTELSQNIQDTFNKAGLEIMTPAVRAVRNSLDPAIPAEYLDDPEPKTRFRVDQAGGPIDGVK